MSLATDSIFVAALRDDPDIPEYVSGRIYGTAIPLPDPEADNVPAPFLIVTFNGLQNVDQTKDNVYEGDSDTVNIGIEVVDKSLDSLHRLTQMVRQAVLNYMQENETPIQDYQFSAQTIQYDSDRPCYWQVLNWSCDVINSLT